MRFLALTAFLMPTLANADIIYNWTGECDPGACTSASGVLTLDDSFTGAPAGLVIDFVITLDGVEYQADLFQPGDPGFDPLLSEPDSFGDSLTEMAVLDPLLGFVFFAYETGEWSFDFSRGGVSGGGIGIDSRFTAAVAVPEPGALILLSIGLVSLGVARRRRILNRL